MFCALPLALLAAAPVRPLVLVKEGKPVATVVLAERPSENARAAAAELVRYLKEISGAELPVATEAPTLTGTLVLVGDSRLRPRSVKVPSGLTRELKEEGLVMVVRGEKLILAGNDTPPYLGTRFAVVELLHRLGVRWFLPGKIGEVIPRLTTVSLPGDLEVRQAPDFPLRTYWEHDRGEMGALDLEWKIHHKMNPRVMERIGMPGDGSIANYIPKEEFLGHPDWFALGPDGKRRPEMVCMTSTGMIASFVQKIDAEAAKGLPASGFSPDDGFPRCECPRCARLATGFDGYGSNDRDPRPESSTSNEWFHFVDGVLEGVWKDHPEHLVAANGYANRDIPPELPSFDRHGNLTLMFANIAACTLHAYDDPGCWQMKRQGEMLRRWAKLVDKVWVYDYSYTMLVGKGTLTTMVHRLRRNIPLLKSWGIIGFNDQDEGDWALTGIATRLVRPALEWDVKTDVDALLSDFYQKWFGAAGPSMKDYYDALESAFGSTRLHGHEDVVLDAVYTPELMSRLSADLVAARQAATEEPLKTRIGLEDTIHRLLLDYLALQEAKRACRYREAAAAARRIVADEEEMNRVTPFMGFEPYLAYGPPWEAERMDRLAAKTEGPEGKLLVELPPEASVRPDPNGDGVFERWQDPSLDESRWGRVLTTAGWDGQGFTDDSGHAYRGVMWYRMSLPVPREARGKRVRLFLPAVVEEAWAWVNGQYAGHRPYRMPWHRPAEMDLEVGDLLEPGKENQLTLRVLANVDVFGASGIYERGFLYLPAGSVL